MKNLFSWIVGSILILLLAAYLTIQVRWIALYRSPMLFDIDEAGYLTMAVRDYISLTSRGVVGWLDTIVHQSSQSPLASALASLLFWVFGQHVVVAYAIPVIALLLTGLATYLVTRAVSGSRTAGVAATVMVLTMPGMVDFSRSFHFAVVASAATAFALLALIRSQGGKHLGWTLALGFFAGLMPLSRTMAISFVPGLFVALLLAWLSTDERRRQRFIAIVSAGVVSVLTAGSWLLFSWHTVLEYLLSFGYGDRASEYGPDRDILARVGALVLRMAQSGKLTHFAVCALGLLLGLLVLAVWLWRSGSLKSPRAIIAKPAFQLAVFVIFGFVALASSRNTGSAFDLPLWPALFALAATGYAAIGFRPLSRLVLGVATVAALVAFVPLADQRWAPAANRPVQVPVLGWIALVDGRGTIGRYVADTVVREDKAQLTDEEVKAWWGLNEVIRLWVARPEKENGAVAFGFRGTVLNVNTVLLNALLVTAKQPQVAVIDTSGGADVGTYQAWLTSGTAAKMCDLLTAEGEAGEFKPIANTPALTEAAALSGFVLEHQVSMPNGRVLKHWARPCPA